MPSVAPTTATPSTTPTSNSGSPLGTTPSGTATPNGGSPVVTTPSTTTTTGSTTLNGTSPLVTTPSIGVLGGTNSSLGPSGSDINTDMNDGGISLQNIRPYSFFTMIIASFVGFLFLWA
ncbi:PLASMODESMATA CALLOSE-BINDING PROTEIN 4-like [Olea europaea var. sylvestris]|uniref:PLASMODESMATA CALLOSE-BINDING PROTEIN 4-like n=1 Tax=Olea europaea var. sylvestris TaxID=158386 RepID=UPI000C1CDEF8|nr:PLASMODESMATA CALLOSE-BINDING PROTEIN 4-like [Olea europaea var. sylvestris]